MASTDGKRRFAPLKAQASNDNSTTSAPKLKGIVFDVDGTLCLPQTYMFAQMRSALGIPPSVDILTHIYSLPTTGGAQAAAMERIQAIEREAMAVQEPQPGLEALMQYLQGKGIRKGICTRNFDAPVEHLLRRFLAGLHFGPVVTRQFRPPKPSPRGIWKIVGSWADEDGWALPVGLEDGEEEVERRERERESGKTKDEEEEEARKGREIDVIMVGDSIDDMTAGYRAGAATVLLVNDVNRHLVEHAHTDLVVERLDDLIGILEEGFVSRDV